MELEAFLTSGFEYDKWANHQWIDAIGGFKRMDRAHQILDHMLQAQRIWLKRCGVEVLPQQVDMSLKELFDVCTDAWKEVISTMNLEMLVTYTTSRGDTYSQPVGHIAMHVINHGTYHRGHLRGLAEADHFDNFPDTDLILYLREKQPAL